MAQALPFPVECRYADLPEPQPEYRFHGVRRWRVDYAWPEYKLALEVEGGHAIGGRHTSVSGFLADMEKYNELAVMGWRIIRVTPRQIKTGEALTWAIRALGDSAARGLPGA